MLHRSYRTLILASVGLVLIASAAPTASAAVVDELTSVSNRIAAPWPELQRGNGTFRDYVLERVSNDGARDRYGEAALGYGLLQTGVRDSNEAAIRAGFKAIDYAIHHPIRGKRIVFQNMLLASAYNFANEHLAGTSDFAAIRGAFEQRLRRMRLVVFGSGRSYYNYYLVETVEVLELLRSGISSSVPGAALARPEDARRLAERLVNEQLPTLADLYTRSDQSVGPLTLLSDPPWNPLAYQAFSSGLLARAIELLGDRASPAANALLDRAVRASWALAAPDGDLAYFGRSNEQGWTLAMTANAAEVAAHMPGTAAEWAGRYAALAQRAAARLNASYLGGPYGSFVTPELHRNLRAGIKHLDSTVTAAAYTGLTLVGLNWAVEKAMSTQLDPSTIASDQVGAVTISRGNSSFVVVRTPDVWFAVKQGPGIAARGRDFSQDPRYSAGLVAAKILDSQGKWRDLIRPFAEVKHEGNNLDPGVGPYLIRQQGARMLIGKLSGQSLAVDSSGTVTMAGGFRTAAGSWLRRGATISFTPTQCGVSVSFAADRNERYGVGKSYLLSPPDIQRVGGSYTLTICR